MEQIPKPIILPGTPDVIIKNIDFEINAFNRWAKSPGNREAELPDWKKSIDADIVLGTHIDILPIWKTLKTRAKLHNDVNLDESLTKFHMAIKSALKGPTHWGDLTPTERFAKHDRIIRTMRGLANDIQDYNLDQHDLVLHEGKPCAGGLVQYADGRPDEFTSFQNLYINQTGIQISEMLRKHALRLETQHRYKSPLTIQTKNTGRELLHFVRSLATYNKTAYGKPLGTVISRLAAAYFPTLETDPAKIRASIRSLNL
jgi:hypothetical protein|tara:strand:+ start:167 stop:940 length:774 start_codon:yes stop_codon:yes gene_type:complete